MDKKQQWPTVGIVIIAIINIFYVYAIINIFYVYSLSTRESE